MTQNLCSLVGLPTKYYFLGHFWLFMGITVIDKAVVDRLLKATE